MFLNFIVGASLKSLIFAFVSGIHQPECKSGRAAGFFEMITLFNQSLGSQYQGSELRYLEYQRGQIPYYPLKG
jgi:hypothetical protein